MAHAWGLNRMGADEFRQIKMALFIKRLTAQSVLKFVSQSRQKDITRDDPCRTDKVCQFWGQPVTDEVAPFHLQCPEGAL